MLSSKKDERSTELPRGAGPELESQSKSGPFQDDQSKGSIHPLLLKAERVKSSIIFDSRGFNSGSLPGPVDLIRQTASEVSVQFKPNRFSSFDFSAMQTEISQISVETSAVTSNTVSTQRLPNDRNILMEEKAHHLQQKPLTETSLGRILPIAALDRLIEGSETCVFPTPKGPRCKNKLHEPVDELPDIFEGLSILNVREDWNAIYPKLERIVKTSLCRPSHGRKARIELLALNGRMSKWANDRDCGTVETFQDHTLALTDTWFKAFCEDSGAKATKLRVRLVQGAKAKCEGVSQNTCPEPTNENTIAVANKSFEAYKLPTFDRRPAKIDRIQYIQTFLPYQPSGLKYLSLQQAVRKVLEMPVTDQELESKYLYVYWSLGNFGNVKIGATDDVPNRLRFWEDQCKHHVQEHLQQASGERRVVKHAYRVEKLVHAELKEFRLQEINCKGCRGKHIEWFRISPEHAAKVIRKYSDWTATSPYQFDISSNKWRLHKHIEENEIKGLCEPIALQQLETSVRSSTRMASRRTISTQKQSPSRYNSPG